MRKRSGSCRPAAPSSSILTVSGRRSIPMKPSSTSTRRSSGASGAMFRRSASGATARSVPRYSGSAPTTCVRRDHLSRRHFLEAPQGLDLLIELRHPVHRIEHHHLGAETLPALRGLGPELRVGLIHAQPTFEPEGGGIPSECF